ALVEPAPAYHAGGAIVLARRHALPGHHPIGTRHELVADEAIAVVVALEQRDDLLHSWCSLHLGVDTRTLGRTGALLTLSRPQAHPSTAASQPDCKETKEKRECRVFIRAGRSREWASTALWLCAYGDRHGAYG